jgi:hypothetical protein
MRTRTLRVGPILAVLGLAALAWGVLLGSLWCVFYFLF